MKQKIQILDGSKVLYEGRISDIPIKEEFIIQKSIELFDDEDPCIIHQSYIIKEYVDVILGLFNQFQTKRLVLSELKSPLSFLNIEHGENCVILLEG